MKFATVVKYKLAKVPAASIWKRSGMPLGALSVQAGVSVDEVTPWTVGDCEEEEGLGVEAAASVIYPQSIV